MLDKKVFFSRQVEECRELASHAVNDEDRAFWLHAADRWEEQLRQAKTHRPQRYVQTKRGLSEDGAEA